MRAVGTGPRGQRPTSQVVWLSPSAAEQQDRFNSRRRAVSSGVQPALFAERLFIWLHMWVQTLRMHSQKLATSPVGSPAANAASAEGSRLATSPHLFLALHALEQCFAQGCRNECQSCTGSSRSRDSPGTAHGAASGTPLCQPQACWCSPVQTSPNRQCGGANHQHRFLAFTTLKRQAETGLAHDFCRSTLYG